ncbi:hypothetical protein M378DRAFT_16716 [Amanita muscaria Koide BX008]|uniref:Uncharacterized protein n=1 Tax=Amanita muscaria (strain Koide BX008) TaxID=946122 RepID=A0A0C2W6S0_AMAMK|nr:hypothetical protein M378DRAFT_16716 [Amanita muscaria Koide BX008]
MVAQGSSKILASQLVELLDIEDVEEREDAVSNRRKNLERDDAKDITMDKLLVEVFS